MKLIPKIGIFDVFGTAKTVTQETQAAKQAPQETIRVKLYDSDRGAFEQTIGEFSHNRLYAFLPAYEQVRRVDKVVVDSDNVPSLYFSKRYHKNLDFDTLAKLTGAAKVNGKVTGKFGELIVEDCGGGFNMAFFDNDISPSWASDSQAVLRSKSLEFLLDVPKRQYLISMALAAMIGVVLGGIGMAFAAGVIAWLT